MVHPASQKATSYIAQLDEARCSGRWSDVPELARKVEKHAPHRSCLTLTARTEATIAAYGERRPTTAASTATTELPKLIPSLITAIEGETEYKQDAFQASVCLGWLHWVIGEPGLAISKLPKDIVTTFGQLNNEEHVAGWTKVCLAKGIYLKGASQEKSNLNIPGALQTYNSVIPYLSSLPSVNTASPEFQRWADALLGRLCLLSDQTAPTAAEVSSQQALTNFRFWIKLFKTKTTSAHISSSSTEASTISPRRQVLKAYYDTLSVILQEDSPYYAPDPAPNGNMHQKGSRVAYTRLQQRAELKEVEKLYESQLLSESQFPKANQSNHEIEIWVDAVIANWRVFCGSTWSDEELGVGGKTAVAREVLDILYRAATKSFHSTQILRYLFTVHASLAEFDLAFKAFDSYVELVTRSKERTAKSGEEDAALDDEDIIIRTGAEAIRILCRFGSRKEAEKAKDVAETIQTWLHQKTPAHDFAGDVGSAIVESTVVPTEYVLSPHSRAVAYRAIGLSYAHWARHTYDTAARSSLQTEALKNFRKALDPANEDQHNLETQYALGLVLAESRDIPGAIRVVKRALSSNPDQGNALSPDGVISDENSALAADYVRERKLLSLWHLLALLLTARSEPHTAVKACEAAFEQFEDAEVLFGSVRGSAKGLVDVMESFEKEGILQIKLTQLALTETLEGANVAVSSCDELVSLFGRLFPDTKEATKKAPTPQAPHTAQSAQSAKPSKTGTIRGNIFRRNRVSMANFEKPIDLEKGQTDGPAINITGDKEKADGHELSEKTNGTTSHIHRTGSKLHKKISTSLHRRSVDGHVPLVDFEKDLPQTNGHESQAVQLPNLHHNLSPGSEPAPVGYSGQPPKQDTRLPTPRVDITAPQPKFPIIQEKRHKASLLTNIWLYIAELYGRAELFQESQEAIDEASNLVREFEAEVAQNSTSSIATAEKGWGGGKSVDELWGDVHAVKGSIAQLKSQPHEALQHFERALANYPDHPSAIVGLSTILLDIYSRAIPQEPVRVTGMLAPSMLTSDQVPTKPKPDEVTINDFHRQQVSLQAPSAANKATPSELNRLAARDRAYGLLSSLTKLGTGWDNSEAWFTLARAYEEGEQVEKAKEVLWWCVELEDAKPLRHWNVVGNGGTVL